MLIAQARAKHLVFLVQNETKQILRMIRMTAV